MAAFYRVSFEVANNEDLRQSFALSGTDATPIDLTGASLKMDVASASGTTALEASTANGRIAILNATAGQIELRVPAGILRGLEPGAYQHDLVLALPSGAVRRVWAGSLMLIRGVTA